MRSFRLPGLLLPAVLVLAACSGGGGASPAASAGAASSAPSAPAAAVLATAEALEGRTFVSTSMTGGDLVAGSTVTLRFEKARIGISAGCNQMSGSYELVDGVLSVGAMMSTEMACEEPLMGQDQAIAAFLPGATATLAADTLTLTKDAVTLTLLDEQVANPDQPLEGTRWAVTDVQAGSTVSSVPAGAAASLTFEGGTVTVEAGCNSGSGTYTVTGDSIAFGAIGTTLKLCGDDVMALEAAVLATLQGTATYTIDGDQLRLVNGDTGLALTAQP
jgi:heat shock protein HslJ